MNKTEDLKSILHSWSDELLGEVEEHTKAEFARMSDDAEGFAYFYQLLFKRRLPKHAMEEWIRPFYIATAAGRGMLIEAFRGSAKTTTLTTALTAFKIGHYPHNSNLLIQVSDEIAKHNAHNIADLIMHNPGWKQVFPHVVPDAAAGWSKDGYQVKRDDMNYAEWRRLCASTKGKDVTLVGLGYRSSAVIGKHPTGLLVIDDIHDENNTRSAVELRNTLQIFKGTILPTITKETQIIIVGTPWTETDILSFAKTSEEFVQARTEVERGSQPVWPDQFPKAVIEKQRRLVGDVEFARMYMLDLKAAAGVHLKREWLHTYPIEKIDPSWPVVMGVDYASVADQLKGGKRDYYTVAVGRVLPGGAGVVLVDGYRGKVSQGEAEEQLKMMWSLYPTTQLSGVEAVGKGEEFYNLLLRSSSMPIVPYHPGGKTKGQRFERGMSPLFQFNRVWIANVDTAFIRAFREEWLSWPYGEHDDTLDAVYWMLRAGVPHLIGPSQKKQPASKNPFAALSKRS
ncbi:MAG: hypothetical protein N2C13_04465 [Chloroflexota bacterium]